MLIRYLIFGVFETFIFIGAVSSESCDRKSTCSCECSNGIVDLKSLGMKDGPRYKDVPALDQYKYSYNPCDPFTETEGSAFEDHCHDVAACQVIDQSGTYQFYDTGTQDSVSFYTAPARDVGLQDIDTDVVVAKYTSKDAARQTEVVLVCNDQDSNTAFDTLGEITNNPPTYRFILVSPHCCFGSGSGLSPGSILLIIFFSLLSAYLIAGVIIQKFRYNASGADLMPNSTFWFELPSLIRDGCNCALRRKSPYKILR